jgi:hypothetical protein
MRRTLAMLVTLLGCALAASPASAAPPYAGTYVTSRPGADSTQELVLVLAPRGRATLTTSYPDLVRRFGAGVQPVRETGGWRVRGQSVELRLNAVGLVRNGALTHSRRENKLIVFALMGCRLNAIRYPVALYGEAGLTFEKSGCTG